jgi:tetratricopeptide (TPR) repeat protein
VIIDARHTPAHKWAFAPRFRRHAFGWRSQPAVQRVREAATEIQKTAKKDPSLAAAGAVLFLEKVSPALEQVDSSSGAIGTAVNHAIEACAKIIAEAPVDERTRDQWLDRLWEAYQNDEIPYIERLGDCWGELCASRERASAWADRLIGTVESVWSPASKPGGYFHGTIACLSALFRAGRYEELLALVDRAPYSTWHYRAWGVKALAAMGRKAEAIRYAEASRGLNDNPIAIARACEEILLTSGLADEAYARYAIEANQRTTFISTFRSIEKKYPTKPAAKILDDLVASTPGQEGKWFAAAKDAGLYDEAMALAQRTPCDPRTLTRAARDFAATNPRFAVEAGMAALQWIAAGYGYEITGLDVLSAYSSTLEAAKNCNAVAEIESRIRELLTAPKSPAKDFVANVLGRTTDMK